MSAVPRYVDVRRRHPLAIHAGSFPRIPHALVALRVGVRVADDLAEMDPDLLEEHLDLSFAQAGLIR